MFCRTELAKKEMIFCQLEILSVKKRIPHTIQGNAAASKKQFNIAKKYVKTPPVCQVNSNEYRVK